MTDDMKCPWCEIRGCVDLIGPIRFFCSHCGFEWELERRMMPEPEDYMERGDYGEIKINQSW